VRRSGIGLLWGSREPTRPSTSMNDTMLLPLDPDVFSFAGPSSSGTGVDAGGTTTGPSSSAIVTSSGCCTSCTPAPVGRSTYHPSWSFSGTYAFPSSSIMLSVARSASSTARFSPGWCRTSSSTAVPIITAFSLSASTFWCRSDVKIVNRPGMIDGRDASWAKPSWFRHSAPRAFGTA
jgi:hypothetical protein